MCQCASLERKQLCGYSQVHNASKKEGSKSVLVKGIIGHHIAIALVIQAVGRAVAP